MNSTTRIPETPTAGSLPRDAGRRTVARVNRYVDAQAIVDDLSDEGFPVEDAAIVGTDLALVEDITGRKRYGRAALEGLSGGAMTGFVIGLFLSIFALFETVVGWFGMLTSWTVLGAVVGALLGLVGHAMQRGRRDFSSVSSVVPGHYDVTVSVARHDEARATLGLADDV